MTPKFSMDLEMLDRHMHERISFVKQLNFPEIFWSKTSVKIMNKKSVSTNAQSVYRLTTLVSFIHFESKEAIAS